jgi:hypothetical protein
MYGTTIGSTGPFLYYISVHFRMLQVQTEELLVEMGEKITESKCGMLAED